MIATALDKIPAPPCATLLGWRLLDVAEALAVHERRVRRVEGILHQPEGVALPRLVELGDAAERRVRVLL